MTGLEPTRLVVKIGFDNPSAVSLSSQTDQDGLIMKFDTTLVLNDVNGNSLVFDDGEKTDDSIDFTIPIQPQLDEENPATDNLETAGESVGFVGSLITLF